ncbi:MAG: non-ribosomal peptide synthetase, partial [bacterium]|nr:non-ribosomal peptide synthetase [bacterium]
KKLNDIELISVEEKQRLLYDFNETEIDYPAEKTIHRLFEEQAERTPENTALVYENRHLTYRELNNESNRLAHRLIAKGVKPDTIVAVLAERSIEMLVGLLGIIKSGGAYLTIDSDYPQERIAYIMADSGAGILITETGTTNVFNTKEMLLLNDEENRALEGQNPPKTSNSGNLLYVIYTSGSTGKPKGVLVEHRGFVNLLSFHKNLFGEGPGERMSQVVNPGFDAMGFEVWPALTGGAALFIAGNDIRSDSQKMKAWIIANRITISFHSTVMVERLLEEEWPSKGVALRLLRTAGDRLTRHPAPGMPFDLYNLYGPTEDTVWTTWTRVDAAAGDAKAPVIGVPVGNHRVYILGPEMKLQPIGVAGELCVSGDGVARGYLNNPELTTERFIRDSQLSAPNPLYRTGDNCRWLPDGTIEFLGRIDFQVKIRGFRIELGEIENCLLSHNQVKEAVVLDRAYKDGDKYLCAYIVPRDHEAIDLAVLKEYLNQTLPAYMVPSFFLTLEKIPLTENGKLNRKALPEPGISSATQYAAPTNEIQEKLVEIWVGVLAVDKEQLGIDNNFFELGGHSLKATQLIAKIHKALDITLSLPQLF